jgi:hypothetical protein
VSPWGNHGKLPSNYDHDENCNGKRRVKKTQTEKIAMVSQKRWTRSTLHVVLAKLFVIPFFFFSYIHFHWRLESSIMLPLTSTLNHRHIIAFVLAKLFVIPFFFLHSFSLEIGVVEHVTTYQHFEPPSYHCFLSILVEMCVRHTHVFIKIKIFILCNDGKKFKKLDYLF